VRVRTLIPALSVIAVGVLALGACGGSSKSSSPSSSAAAGGTAPKSAFCQSLSNFLSSAYTAFNDSTLSDIKRDFPKVVSTAKTLNPAPATLRQAASKTTGDVEQLDTWVQTQATQQDLNANNIPGAIKGPYTDLQTQAKTLSSYAKNTCGITGPSSGSSGTGNPGSSNSPSGASGSSTSGNT
jgi:hypothetical protein